MNINAINSVPFKGTMIITNQENGRDYHLDDNRILGIKQKPTSTEIKYNLPQEIRRNGHVCYVPKIYKVNLDANSVLNAYNAIKDSKVTVDLSEKVDLSDYPRMKGKLIL